MDKIKKFLFTYFIEPLETHLTAILIVLSFSILLTAWYWQEYKEITLPKDIWNCEQSGGNWLKFSSSCANLCPKIRQEPATCQQKRVESCNCGNNKCWDEELLTCINQ